MAKYRKRTDLTPQEISYEEDLAQMKVEIAKELGLYPKIESWGWGSLTPVETGRIGGIITRRMRKSGQNK